VKAEHRARLVLSLKALATTFNVELTDERIACYEMALGDLQIETIEAGAREAMRTCKFFPVPAEIRGKGELWVWAVRDELAERRKGEQARKERLEREEYERQHALEPMPETPPEELERIKKIMAVRWTPNWECVGGRDWTKEF